MGRLGPRAAAVVALCVLLASATSARAAVFNFYPVPWTIQGNSSITTGPDGALWFTDGGGDFTHSYIGRITTSGTITQFTLPAYGAPEGIVAGPDGALWFAEYARSKIARMTTAGLVINEYPTTGSPARITTGPNGALWFTETASNLIGTVAPGATNVTEYGGLVGGANPIGIVSGPDGALWFAENGSDKVGRMTIAGAVTNEFPVLGSNAPLGIAAGPDGNLWVTYLAAGQVTSLTTGGAFSAFGTPRPRISSWAITAGPDNALYYSETFIGGAIVRIAHDNNGTAIHEYPLPNGGQPNDITLGPDGNLWFIDFNNQAVGEMIPDVPPVVATAAATNVSDSAATLTGTARPRGAATTVQFQWGSTSAYGNDTPVQSAGSDDATHRLSAALSGLAPSTTYHFRIVAMSANGSSYGGDTTFTTAPLPPPSLTLGKATTKGRTVSFVVTCQGSAAQTCSGSFSLTSLEHLSRRGSVTAVTARKLRTKRVTVAGSVSVSVVGGARRTVVLTLNAQALRLLGRLGRLPATLAVVTPDARPPASQQVVFHVGRPRRRHR